MRKLSATLCLLGLSTITHGADLRALVKDLSATSNDARRTAALDLGKLGEDAKPAVPHLIKALKDQDIYVRKFAAQSLGEIGTAPGSVEALTAALNDTNSRVIEAAAEALGSMGTEGVKPLAKLLGNKKLEDAIRKLAADSLRKLGPKAKGAVGELTLALDDPKVRIESVQALAAIGTDAKPALEKMEALMEDRRVRRDKGFSQALRRAIREIQRAK